MIVLRMAPMRHHGNLKENIKGEKQRLFTSPAMMVLRLVPMRHRGNLKEKEKAKVTYQSSDDRPPDVLMRHHGNLKEEKEKIKVIKKEWFL